MLRQTRLLPFSLVPCLAALPAQEPRPQDPPAQAPSPVPATRRQALERAAQSLPPATPDQGAMPIPARAPLQNGGGLPGPLTQLDVSVDLLTALGHSSARDGELRQLQGGMHDPRKRGFTLQQAELQINGAVDPYFRGQFVLVSALEPDEGETIVEVEEAWLTTQNLPYNLQVKAGHYLTEFGRMNPVHPHAWDFQDQPVMLSRLFGPDGLRSPGARVSYLAPTPTYLEFYLGAQNANGETLESFYANDEVYEERGIGGRFLDEDARQRLGLGDLMWQGRIATAMDFDAANTLAGGVSALFGPNATGPNADTTILGADVMYRWRPVDNRRGYPFFKVQAEFLARRFEAAGQQDTADPLNPIDLPSTTLRDYGGYLYVVYGFAVGWAVGLRGEFATGSGASYLGGGDFARADDPFRCNRTRISPMLSYQTSEYSRLRLQYNYDRSDHLDDPAHSVWLGFEILMGPHPPHAY